MVGGAASILCGFCAGPTPAETGSGDKQTQARERSSSQRYMARAVKSLCCPSICGTPVLALVASVSKGRWRSHASISSVESRRVAAEDAVGAICICGVHVLCITKTQRVSERTKQQNWWLPGISSMSMQSATSRQPARRSFVDGIACRGLRRCFRVLPSVVSLTASHRCGVVVATSRCSRFQRACPRIVGHYWPP